MEKTQELIRVVHVPDPCVPSSVFETVTKPCEEIAHYEGGKGGMLRNDDIANDAKPWSKESNASLPEAHVNRIVEQSREEVTKKGNEEDERYDRVALVVIYLELEVRSVGV